MNLAVRARWSGEGCAQSVLVDQLTYDIFCHGARHLLYLSVASVRVYIIVSRAPNYTNTSLTFPSSFFLLPCPSISHILRLLRRSSRRGCIALVTASSSDIYYQLHPIIKRRVTYWWDHKQEEHLHPKHPLSPTAQLP
jgi:hypothetical protein